MTKKMITIHGYRVITVDIYLIMIKKRKETSFSNKYPPKKRPIITEVSSCNSSFDCNFSKTIFTIGMHKGVNKRRSV